MSIKYKLVKKWLNLSQFKYEVEAENNISGTKWSPLTLPRYEKDSETDEQFETRAIKHFDDFIAERREWEIKVPQIIKEVTV
jgi:hypothetical protein